MFLFNQYKKNVKKKFTNPSNLYLSPASENDSGEIYMSIYDYPGYWLSGVKLNKVTPSISKKSV